MAGDPVLNTALKNLMDSDAQMDEAKKLMKVLQDAGEDVSSQRASLQQMETKRNKLKLSLQSNGAVAE
jgi:hypothetical protein